jgi:tryptophan halogenase
MNNKKIRRIVIAGGGTAGWMTAAGLAAILPVNDYDIKLVESEQIGTVGVGEASIPPLLLFNHNLGVSEAEFMKKTGATFKLGIEFHNWKKKDEHYFHPFGQYGRSPDGVDFHHYWMRARENGYAPELGDFALCETMAKSKKFAAHKLDPKSVLSTIGYAYHLDAGLYAKFLREYAEKKGVTRIEGKIVDVKLKETNGYIDSIQLDSSEIIEGDLFVDCSGFRGLLIEGALKTGYEDWSHYLPCDSAIAVPSENVGDTRPYTMSTAHAAGWQWRIPLQHRTGNGHIFCSQYMSQDEATSTLLENLEGKPLAEPRLIKFTTGRRKKFWNKNCVAIGLSAGFMEPLESTSIHLIQQAIGLLLQLLPGDEFNEAEIQEFNNVTARDYELIRDFLVMHYHVNERPEDFWQMCQKMDIPDSLKHRLAIYKNSGRLFIEQENLFKVDSWLAVLHGQGVRPSSYDPVADRRSLKDITKMLDMTLNSFTRVTKAMPTHDQIIQRNFKAKF